MNSSDLLFRVLPKSRIKKIRKMIQLDPDREWFEDRRAEVCEYTGLSEKDLAELQKEHSIDSNEYRDNKMCAAFEGADSMTQAELMESYRQSSTYYILRLMLAYDRVKQALPFLNLMYRRAPGGKILDYGCGASDTGLVFASCGFEISICDIAGGNLEFAKWRYERRNLAVKTIGAADDDIYPDLGNDLDFIAALEILEHLPSPTKALGRIHQSLKPGGVFAVREESFEEKHDGDHLHSAFTEWQTGLYTAERERLFRDVTPGHGRRFRGGKYMKLYEKR